MRAPIRSHRLTARANQRAENFAACLDVVKVDVEDLRFDVSHHTDTAFSTSHQTRAATHAAAMRDDAMSKCVHDGIVGVR
jgi:hypothetical protein